MKPRTIEELVTLVFKALPYSNQIEGLAFESGAIRFRWRSQHFRVTTGLEVDTVGDGILIGDDASIVLSALLVKFS